MWNLEAKLLFIGLFTVLGCLEPFQSLFLQDKGFGTVQIGVVASVTRVCGIFTTPVLCTIADHFKCHRLMLLVMVVIATAMMTALLYVPEGNLLWTSLFLGIYTSAFVCQAVLTETIVMEILTRQEEAKRLEERKQERRASSIRNSINGREEGAVNESEGVEEGHENIEDDDTDDLADAVPEEISEEAASGAGAKYPAQRVWGSVAYGIVAFVVGLLIEQYGEHGEGGSRPYLLIPGFQCLFFIFFGAIAFVTYLREEMLRYRIKLQREKKKKAHMHPPVPEPSKVEETVDKKKEDEEEQEQEEERIMVRQTLERLRAASIVSSGLLNVPPTLHHHSKRSIGTQLCNLLRFSFSGPILGPVIFGLAILFLSDVVCLTFVFAYARTELNGTPTIFSLATGAQLTSEVILFFACSWLVKKIGSMWMLMISGIAYGSKLMAYSLMPNAWLLVPIGMGHGFCYAVMWSAIVAHVTNFAKEFEQRVVSESKDGNNDKGDADDDKVHHGDDGDEGEKSALLKKDDGIYSHSKHHSEKNVSVRSSSARRRSSAHSHRDGSSSNAQASESFVPTALNVLYFWVGMAGVIGGLLPVFMGDSEAGPGLIRLLFRGCAVACWTVAVAARVYGWLGILG